MEKVDKVIRALELHTGAKDGKTPCPECPYVGYEMYCLGVLEKDALDVIEALRVERDDLRKDVETLNRINEDWRVEVARLHERIVAARDLGAKTAPVAEAATKPGTNYLRIAKMGPWALADWIFRTGTICECCVRQGVCGIPEELVTEEYCLEHILMWLAQEAEK